MDFEGLPEENFTYLIGIVIREDEAETQLSFWADSITDEERIFKQLFDTLSNLHEYRVYHYGGYENRILKKINKRYNNAYDIEINQIAKNSIDQNSVN